MAVKSKSGRILMIEVSSKLKFHKEALKKQGIMKKVDFAKRQSNDESKNSFDFAVTRTLPTPLLNIYVL